MNGQNQSGKQSKLSKKNGKQKAVDQLTPEQQELLKLQIKRDWIQKECQNIQVKYDNLDIIIHQNTAKIEEMQQKIDYITEQAKQAIIVKQNARAKQLLVTRKQIEQSMKTQSFYLTKYQEQQATLEAYLDNMTQYRDIVNLNYMQQQQNIDKLLEDMQEAGYNLQLIKQAAEQINASADMQIENEEDELADEFLKLQQQVADETIKQIQLQSNTVQQQQVQQQGQQQQEKQPQQILQ